MIDTHTADGLKVAVEYRQQGCPMVVLETAQAVSVFTETIREALGREPLRPVDFAGLEDMPQRVEVMEADAERSKELHCPALRAMRFDQARGR